MRVLLLLSGGGDSAAAGLLLRRAGHSVLAATMDLPGTRMAEAKRVAKALGARHVVLRVAETFRREILDAFKEGLVAGVTYNPCALCNAKVKLGEWLLELLDETGCDAIATGHYARVEGGIPKVARDLWRSQEYFLALVSPRVMERMVFPLGEVDRDTAWGLVRSLGLRPPRSSQDLCFVRGTLTDWIARELGTRPGPIVDEGGKVLGRHRGAHFYTLGQRDRLGISTGRRMYVVAKEGNTLVVSPRPPLRRDFAVLAWNSFLPGWEGLRGLRVRLAYRGKLLPVRRVSGNRVWLAQPGVPVPGQVAAVYHEDRVVAGGIIAPISDKRARQRRAR